MNFWLALLQDTCVTNCKYAPWYVMFPDNQQLVYQQTACVVDVKPAREVFTPDGDDDETW